MALKSTLEDAKDRLDALLTYANGVTGESDTSIGDAIETLADGYGHGGGGVIPSPWASVQGVTIGANSVAKGADAHSYFNTAYPSYIMAVLKDSPSANNQVLICFGRANTFLRFRNSAIETVTRPTNTNGSWDAALVEGTHYDVYTVQ